jgi:hypothetical protein
MRGKLTGPPPEVKLEPAYVTRYAAPQRTFYPQLKYWTQGWFHSAPWDRKSIDRNRILTTSTKSRCRH